MARYLTHFNSFAYSRDKLARSTDRKGTAGSLSLILAMAIVERGGGGRRRNPHTRARNCDEARRGEGRGARGAPKILIFENAEVTTVNFSVDENI